MSFIAITGRSGCGKTKIINLLIKKFPSFYKRAKSFTTRPRRNEEDNEYVFISNDQMHNLLENGRILYIDDVYGYKYAMDKEAFCLGARDFIKEIHPNNVSKITDYCNDLIVVNIKSDDFYDSRGRIENNNVKFINYDITITNDKDEDLEDKVNNLSRMIQAVKMQREFNYPPSDIIDCLNKDGYNRIACEFNDVKRTTTANFHDVSVSFFRSELKKCKPDDLMLEVGSGNGWLDTILGSGLQSIDIAENMNAGKNQKCFGIRQYECQSNKYDTIFASLCDPFFYPEAIAVLIKILKNNGKLIISIPSYKWCILNRDGSIKTKFINDDGSTSEVYSFIYPKTKIKLMGRKLGFKISKYKECFLGRDYSGKISDEIRLPALTHNLDIDKLCIVECYVLKKEY